jgi:hypothetical protein
MGFYAVFVGSSLPSLQDRLSISSPRDLLGCPEMSANNYQSTLLKNSGDQRLQMPDYINDCGTLIYLKNIHGFLTELFNWCQCSVKMA